MYICQTRMFAKICQARRVLATKLSTIYTHSAWRSLRHGPTDWYCSH